MRRFYVLIAVLLVLLSGCNGKPEIAYMKIVPGGVDNLSIASVTIDGNEFYLDETMGQGLSVLIKDENGYILDYLAEWVASNYGLGVGDLSDRISRTTTYWPKEKGIHTVSAKVGEHVASATFYTYGFKQLYSGDGSIRANHAINFKTSETTDDISEADMILLNEYYPDKPYYAKSNKIVFPNGFLPVSMPYLKVQGILEVPSYTEDQLIYELELTDLAPRAKQDFSGFVRNLDNSHTKISGVCGIQLLNDEPYLNCGFQYLRTSEGTTFPY